jgi:hypothetical protein
MANKLNFYNDTIGRRSDDRKWRNFGAIPYTKHSKS